MDGRASGLARVLSALSRLALSPAEDACHLLTCGFSRCSSQMLFLRPCCSERGLGASSLSVSQGRLEVEPLGPRPPRPWQPPVSFLCLQADLFISGIIQ